MHSAVARTLHMYNKLQKLAQNFVLIDYRGWHGGTRTTVVSGQFHCREFEPQICIIFI